MILLCYGTRPELIKLFPIAHELKRQNIPYQTLFTGQHQTFIKKYKCLIDKPTYTLNVFKRNQNLDHLYSKLLRECSQLFKKHSFQWVMVQGDTASSLAVAHSAFHHQIKISHVEAGLRTYNKYSPFPEEMNRMMISRMADLHFAPTLVAYNNLLNENIQPNTVYHVGNTIADALLLFHLQPEYTDTIIITLHRRENKNEKICEILHQIHFLASKYPDLQFIYIEHPSNQKKVVDRYLYGKENIQIVQPQDYVSMLELLSKCLFIITDSGGIQEEAICLGKKIIICRDTTERPEAIELGFGSLVGHKIIECFEYYLTHFEIGANHFYGKNVSTMIVNILKRYL